VLPSCNWWFLVCVCKIWLLGCLISIVPLPCSHFVEHSYGVSTIVDNSWSLFMIFLGRWMAESCSSPQFKSKWLPCFTVMLQIMVWVCILNVIYAYCLLDDCWEFEPFLLIFWFSWFSWIYYCLTSFGRIDFYLCSSIMLLNSELGHLFVLFNCVIEVILLSCYRWLTLEEFLLTIFWYVSWNSCV